MIRRSAIRVLLLLLTADLAGCGPHVATGTQLAPMPEITPVAVGSRVHDTLVFLGVDLSQVGPRVGARYDGLMKVRQYYIDLNPTVLSTWAGWMKDVGRQELEAAGYRLKVPSSLFSQLESYTGVRFALAGRPTVLRNDTYGSLVGNNTRAAIQVAWELFDVKSRAVIFRAETAGAGLTAGASGDAVSVAFRVAMRRLLANAEFAELVVGSSPTRVEAVKTNQQAVAWRRPIPGESEMVSLPRPPVRDSRNAIQRTSPAVVSLRGPAGSGSAFLVTPDGFAITNYHVIQDQASIAARMADGIEQPVRVVRSDSASDLALVQIQCSADCPYAVPFKSTPQPGDEVFAIGAPLSLTQTVTRGIVSGTRRRGTISLIQTDAAINPGNSGGPLIDAKTGDVIGVVTSKLVAPGLEGLGFAISINDALRVLGFMP